MMKTLVIGLALIACCGAAAQPTTKVYTKGQCNAVVVGHSNSVVINCGALTKEDAEKLVSILNEVRQSNIDLNTVLQKLDAILAQVKATGDPNHGNVSYKPDGTKVTTSAGSIIDSEGYFSEYRKLVTYENSGRWQEQVELAEALQQKEPTWLTPMIFAAEAHFNLCSADEANSEFRAFIAKASDEPIYQGLVDRVKATLSSLPATPQVCRSNR